MTTNKRKIIAIVGPTASGKTAIGVKLAKEFNGEIISADSRQVFRGLDIGTGKDLAEYHGVKYHMIDIKDPGEKFSLFDYLPLARAAISDIFSREKVPIIVGGTGLYVQGLVEGFKLSRKSPVSPSVCQGGKVESGKYTREELEKLTIEELNNLLIELDKKVYDELADKKNPHRLIRAIERSQEGIVTTKEKPDFDVLQIGLFWPKEILDKRIDKRVDDRFEQGMLEEVNGLLNTGVDPEWLMSLGLEYRVITNYVLSNLLEESSEQSEREALRPRSFDDQNYRNSKQYIEMVSLLKTKSHQYAKRQITWFKRFPEIVWENDYEKIRGSVSDYLK